MPAEILSSPCVERSDHGYAPSVVARFWRFVIRRGSSDCWLWTGSLARGGGYGSLWMGSKAEPPIERAHRFSCRLHIADIPTDAFVCHRCDVRACVNPSHLFLGSCLDNLADMHAKGRGPGKRITAEIVARVEALRGLPGREIGSLVGISPQSVWRILSRQRIGVPGEARESEAARLKRKQTRAAKRAAKLGQPSSPVVPPAGSSGPAESGPDSRCPTFEAHE